MGKVAGGLATYSKYQPKEVMRYQLPGAFPFPKNVYMLDRCLLVQRYDLSSGKQMLVVNLHNSAYDNTGKLKAQEMAYLKNFITQEYEKGNYVIVGGDWNQNPPGFDNNTFSRNLKETYPQTAVMADFMPADWKWAFDATTASNRNLVTAYDKDKTFTTLIDFFLLSPNVDLVSVKGAHVGFQFSDHQPVKLQVKLR
jgi:endonuclease/exonuclease/phosphatase family metal-dependent hydrolase